MYIKILTAIKYKFLVNNFIGASPNHYYISKKRTNYKLVNINKL